MTIYELVFGQSSGQVCCAFHPDTRASAGVSDIGQYNCFACGAKAHNEEGFIMKYFNVDYKRASKIKYAIMQVGRFRYTLNEVNDEQRAFLNNAGITDEIIKRYMFRSAQDKLMFRHMFNGQPIGYTWFNSPLLSNHNSSAEKYKYAGGTIAGMVTPYDDVLKYDTLIITEGEKDMLTAKSLGIKNVVAKIGGANSDIIAGINFDNKNVILVYDCDDPGREGAENDAYLLTEQHKCKVKIVDLGLQDKEDLNDFFIKYGKTVQDFYALFTQTPVYVPTPRVVITRLQRFIDGLNDTELIEVDKLIQKRKGEQNGN